MRSFGSTAAGAGRRPVPRSLLVLALAGVLGAGALSGCTAGTTARGAGSGATACNASTVAEKDLPSVVTITVSSAAGASSGSGEIIRDEGSILTNNHVVAPAANGGSVSVLLSDGRSYPATITGRDPQTDVAVVKIDAGKLPAIALGSSTNLKIGEPVVALGAPLGLSNTVTTGIVSALERTVQVPSDNGNATLLAAIQTDAAINPGNSGGTLADCGGALIGVPTAIATVTTATGQSSAGSVGIGFAVPVEIAMGVADEIIATGKVTHSYFGIAVQASPPTDGGSSAGLYVTSVVPGGPAATAGLQEGDVITEIDGEPATDALQLALLSLKKKPDDTVAVTFDRAGTSMKATVTLTAPP